MAIDDRISTIASYEKIRAIGDRFYDNDEGITSDAIIKEIAEIIIAENLSRAPDYKKTEIITILKRSLNETYKDKQFLLASEISTFISTLYIKNVVGQLSA